MSGSDYAKKMLQEAKDVLAKNPGVDRRTFQNLFLGIGNTYVPTRGRQRSAFLSSPEFEEFREMVDELPEDVEDGSGAEDPPSLYSGKIVARVGHSLHRALVEEAAIEAMSLNQLILAKLAPPLYERVRTRE